jgi:predicted nucleic acid-binding protein
MVIDACLADTNVLLRIPRRSDPNHAAGDNALSKLAIQGTILHYTHENIAELWNTMTRPQSRNGFGLTVQDAGREVELNRIGHGTAAGQCRRLSEWRRIVVQYGVSQVRDARLAAAINTHGISHILTFNGSDFSRFSGITAIHPAAV